MAMASQTRDDIAQVVVPIARAAIAAEFGPVARADESASWLNRRGACFVTLRQGVELRGCIGTLEACRSLLLDIKGNAVAAAFRDPRFAPLVANELPHTVIEVSILSIPQSMSFADESDALRQLRPHSDGLVLQWRNRRATFLPQVWETLGRPEEFMSELKRKAGLPVDFWSEELRLARYTVTKHVEESGTLPPESWGRVE